MKIANISGATIVIILFIFASVLSKFDLPFEIFFVLSITYSIFFLVPKFIFPSGWKKQSFILAFHYFLLFYLASIYLFSILADINDNSLPHFWSLKSILVFVSVLLLNIVIIKTSEKNIKKTLVLIKNLSFFVIFESIISYFLPNNINIFISDFEAGYRFTSFLMPGYILTGLFLILGYTSYLYLNRSKSNYKFFFIFLLFCFALIQTQDRTSILTFLGLNLFALYKNTASKVFIFSVYKKFIFLINIVLMLVLVFFAMQNIGERKNFLSFSSVIDRYTLFVRGVNITKEVLPIGGGPGSQVRLMFSEKIPFNQEIDAYGEYKEIRDKSRKGISFREDFNYSKEYIRKRVGSGKTMSPHNTYLDFSISLGIIGIVISLSILFIQCRALISVIINQDKSNYFLSVLLVCSFILFMSSSLINSIWLFVIFYRAFQTKTF